MRLLTEDGAVYRDPKFIERNCVTCLHAFRQPYGTAGRPADYCSRDCRLTARRVRRRLARERAEKP